jgi:hypothetical protein
LRFGSLVTTSVSGPGHQAAISRSAADGTRVTRPITCLGLRTSTGSGKARERFLASKIRLVPRGENASAATP